MNAVGLMWGVNLGLLYEHSRFDALCGLCHSCHYRTLLVLHLHTLFPPRQGEP